MGPKAKSSAEATETCIISVQPLTFPICAWKRPWADSVTLN